MQKKSLSYLTFLLLISLLSGCSELFTFTTRDAPISEAPSVKHQGEISNQQHGYLKRDRYFVDANDVLNISVFGEPELSASVRVTDEGMLSYPLIGDIKVKGLTTQEVEDALEKRLRDGYLKDPKVTIRLDIELMEIYQQKEIFVLGEVKNPGAIPILGKYTTVLEAVIKAGGFTDIAAPSRTKVVRVEDGVEKTIKVNLNEVKKGNKSQDIILKAGDIVVIPETYF